MTCFEANLKAIYLVEVADGALCHCPLGLGLARLPPPPHSHITSDRLAVLLYYMSCKGCYLSVRDSTVPICLTYTVKSYDRARARTASVIQFD